MKKANIYLSCLFSIVLAISTSCIKDEINMNNISETDWCPDGALPLINSDLGLWDILKDYDSTDIFVIDSSQFIYLIYEDTVFSRKIEDLLPLHDQSFTESVEINLPPISFSEQKTIDKEIVKEFNFDGMKLDSILFKKGNLQTTISTNLNIPSKIVFSINGATKNGKAFKDSISFDGHGGNATVNTDLNGMKFVFDQTHNNRITIKMAITLFGNGTIANPSYTMNIGAFFNNMKFKRMYGYFGQHDLNLNNDTVSLRLYTNTIDGTINWEDPRLFINIYNSMGMPIRVNVNYLTAVRTLPPAQRITITGTGIPNPWDINYPTNAGEVVKSSISVTRNNSNIADILNISPQKILAIVGALTNPGGTSSKNFVTDESRLSVEAKLELPMHGSINGLILQDTFDLDFGTIFDRIDYIQFKLFTRNNFPLSGRVQLYFCDSNFNIKDSLLDVSDQFIRAATPGSTSLGITTGTADNMIDQIYENNRVQHLKKATKILVRARIDTYNNGSVPVKLYSYYRMIVKLSARLQMKFSSRDI